MPYNDSTLVTAIVSTYASERFIEGCLVNLAAQSIFDRMEVIVIDAASPEDEGSIVKTFQDKYSNIRYIRTPERIGIYPAWNIGVREARGKYLTNANTDDRRHPQCTEKLVMALEENPEAVLAYSDILITNEENSEFGKAEVVDTSNWLDHDHLNLLRRCEVGPMPVWRASLHDELGMFDERYIGAGDYEFWLRSSEEHSFIHVDEPLGLYLRYDNNLETRNMQRKINEEYLTKSTYIQRFMDSGISPQEAVRLLQFHSKAVTDTVAAMGDGIGCDELNRFEYHYYACALMLAMNNRKDDAVSMLEDWLRNVNTSKNIAHLLYALILKRSFSGTSESRVAFFVIDDAHPELLGRTLSSLLDQDHQNWELTLISDDPGIFENRISSLTTYPRLGESFGALPEDKRKLEILPHVETGSTGLYSLLLDVLSRSVADYLCILHAGEVLSPDYVSEAALMLDSNSRAGWISPKSLFFGTYAFTAFGTEFSLKSALCEPPSAGASLFRNEAKLQVQVDEHDLSDFEKWGLWIKMALAGWKGLALNEFAIVRNMVHGENLMERKQKALRRIVADYSGFYHRDPVGNMTLNDQEIQRVESAPNSKERMEIVRAMKCNNQESDSGRLRLANHFLRKNNFAKAREQLENILSEDPDNMEARKLLESCPD